MKKNEINIKILVLLMTVFILLGIFVACGGLPASRDQEEETIRGTPGTWMDPPDFQLPSSEFPDYELPTFEIEEAPDDYNPPSTIRYAASRESDRYHLKGCYYVDNILPENLIYFSSEYAARQAGYSPCAVCKP